MGPVFRRIGLVGLGLLLLAATEAPKECKLWLELQKDAPRATLLECFAQSGTQCRRGPDKTRKDCYRRAYWVCDRLSDRARSIIQEFYNDCLGVFRGPES